MMPPPPPYPARAHTHPLSVELAEAEGPYESFEGSPLSEGKFQFDLWGVDASQLSGRWDWEALRARVCGFRTRAELCR